MTMEHEQAAVQANLEQLGKTVESLGANLRQGLARFLRASPDGQAAAMATSHETALALTLLLGHLRAHPKFRPLMLSLLEGG
jgi:hypothetical protein